MADARAVDDLIREADRQRDLFRHLKRYGRLTPAGVRRLAQNAAEAFMSARRSHDGVAAETLALLCEMAVSEDPALSTSGTHALFTGIVEPLADSFDPRDGDIYYTAFARVIEFCRRLPQGKAINDRLNQFGLSSEQHLLRRIERIRARRPFDLTRSERIKKALILSRVTLGADVEITSIIWQKLKTMMPRAELVLLGGEKLHELFGGEWRLRIHPIEYDRSGDLIDRLSSWLNLVEVVAEETRDLHPDEFIVVDPDSRLTQLGMLPVVADERSYYFFESRCYQKRGAESLGQLTAYWVNEIFGDGERLSPRVSLRRRDLDFARTVMRQIRRGHRRPLISVNLGVGENPRKRIPGAFEQELVVRLMRDGATILLDKGAGAEEAARIGAIVEVVRASGRRVVELSEAGVAHPVGAKGRGVDVFTWCGGIGRFSALVAQTDHYVGYDSAGQHIAVALGVPTVVIFAGYRSPRFVKRWRPAGRGPVKVICVDAASRPEVLIEEVAYAVSNSVDD